MRKWVLPALAAVAAMLGITAPAHAQFGGQQNARIKCESQQYRPASCAVPGIAEARIVEQLGGRCVQGQDWDFDRRGINVSNGCRAWFYVQIAGNGYPGSGYPGGGYPGGAYPGAGNPGYGAQAVTCESKNYRPARCAMNTRGGVRIQRILGGSPCRQGQSWGFDRGGVWVNNGCRAEFVANGGGYPGGGYPGGGGGYGQIVECSSQNYRPARCAADVRGGVQVERVLGSNECVEGQSWGFNRNSIWVNNGCRARFRVY